MYFHFTPWRLLPFMLSHWSWQDKGDTFAHAHVLCCHLRNTVAIILTQSPDWGPSSNEQKPVCHKWPPIAANLFLNFSLLLTLVRRRFWTTVCEGSWSEVIPACVSSIHSYPLCHFGQHPNHSTQARPLLGSLHLLVRIQESEPPLPYHTHTLGDHNTSLREHSSFLYCVKQQL